MEAGLQMGLIHKYCSSAQRGTFIAKKTNSVLYELLAPQWNSQAELEIPCHKGEIQKAWLHMYHC